MYSDQSENLKKHNHDINNSISLNIILLLSNIVTVNQRRNQVSRHGISSFPWSMGQSCYVGKLIAGLEMTGTYCHNSCHINLLEE